MASYNHVHLIGNLGTDPEVKSVKTAKGDSTVATFRLATNEVWKANGQEQTRTDWHTVEVWGVQAKNVGEYLSKGREVTVVGKLRVDTWEKEGQKQSRVKVGGKESNPPFESDIVSYGDTGLQVQRGRAARQGSAGSGVGV